MVDTAMASTMTMPVAADRPPMKASQRQRRLPRGQRQRQHEGLGVGPAARAAKYSSPPSAIGSTNRLISSR
jgi:hypothetical protein